MHITVDLSPAVHRHAGLGRYAHELVTALLAIDRVNEYCGFYYAPKGIEAPDPPLDRLPRHSVRLDAKPWRMGVLLGDFTGVSLDRWLPRSDVFHATDHLLPPLRHSATVFTIHDLIFRFFPNYHLPLNRWYLSLMLPRFLQCAHAIIAVSENTRRDVVRLMHVPEEKITVIYEGVSPRFYPVTNSDELARIRARYQLPARFILFLSTIEPRKNLVTLLDAYHSLLTRESGIPDLVIAGRKGWLYEPVFRRVRELGIHDRVHFTGWVDEADAPALLSAAMLFVYPSLYEGFGLPPLEAMACGVPLICSNASSLPEVVGNAGILVNPRDTGGLTEAMMRVLADDQLRIELRGRGLERVQQFLWERTARETLQVYERVSRKMP